MTADKKRNFRKSTIFTPESALEYSVCSATAGMPRGALAMKQKKNTKVKTRL